MKRYIALLAMVCLLLSGCSTWLDGSYVSTVPHEEHSNQTDSHLQAVSSYSGLYRALKNMIRSGRTSALISVANYNQLVVARDVRQAVENLKANDAVGAYAVEEISFELGTSAGKPALSVNIQYYHNRTDLQNLKTVSKMDYVDVAIAEALTNCNSSLILLVQKYEERDFTQWVEDYAEQYPQIVMEKPEVSVSTYPQSGDERVLELKFTYQNSRDVLRSMQNQVSDRFQTALTQAQEAQTEQEKYEAVCSYLTLQSETYQVETSITPGYMLLIHGVGDSSAFATFYSAVCRELGLESIVVTGTREGAPWKWNIICVDGIYYHVDILRSVLEGNFRMYADSEMEGYTWDFSLNPPCGVPTPEE